MLVSSENNVNENNLDGKDIPLMEIQKRRGPRIEPYETPTQYWSFFHLFCYTCNVHMVSFYLNTL